MAQYFIHQFLEDANHKISFSNNMGTQTLTETREQPDTDANFQGNMIPKDPARGIMTKTNTREQPDEEVNMKGRIIPVKKNIYGLGTATLTKTRETPDTDINSMKGYIPKNE